MDLNRNKAEPGNFELAKAGSGGSETVQAEKGIGQEVDFLQTSIRNRLSEFEQTGVKTESDIRAIDPKADFNRSELAELEHISGRAKIEALKAEQSLQSIKDQEALDVNVEQNALAENETKENPVLAFFRQQEQKVSGAQYQPLEWKQEHLNVYETLAATHGPFVEIGGPTTEGFEQVDIKALDGKFFTSNIESDIPEFDKSGNIVGKEKVDLQSDARILPFRDSSIGAVFASNLGSAKYNKRILDTGEIRRQAIAEASRVLKDNGLLIWEGGHTEDFVYADEAGFQLIQFKLEMGLNNQPRYNCILKKLPAKS